MKLKYIALFFFLSFSTIHPATIEASDKTEELEQDKHHVPTKIGKQEEIDPQSNTTQGLVITDDLINQYLAELNPTNNLIDGYRKLNEEDALVNLYQKAEHKDFQTLDEKDYREFLTRTSLFDTGGSQKRKVFSLMLWAQLAGCPLLAVSQCHPFFHSSLHVYSPQDAKTFMNQYLPKKINDMPEQERNTLISTFPYEKGCQEVGIRINANNYTYKVRSVTQDLRENAIIYLYLNAQKTNVDSATYNATSQTHYKSYPLGRISYDFLQDYIIPLSSIMYLDHVLAAFEKLPKSVVNVMRGKAIYLSKATGTSVTLSSTSHNMPISTYLGFIPGIFIEESLDSKRNSKISSLTKNYLTFENIIHEVGHLIDHTVLRALYEDSRGRKSIPFFYQFPKFIELKTISKRDELFTGNQKYLLDPNSYLKVKDDQRLGNKGYITHYSEKDKDEDFAEHFKFYVLDKTSQSKIFDAAAKKENELRRKYLFMMKLIEATDSSVITKANQ